MSGVVLGVAGLVVSGITAGVSFGQAAKARKKQKDADRLAYQYLDEAKKNIHNRYAELGISKTPYKQESDALIAAGAQLTEAAAEGDQRGVGATAGKIQAVQTQGQAGVRDKMTEDIQTIETLKAQGATDADQRREAIELGMANKEFSDANTYGQEAANLTQSGITAAGQAAMSGIGAISSHRQGNFGRQQRQLNKQLGGDRGSTEAIQTRFAEMAADPTKYANAQKLVNTKASNSPQFKNEWAEIAQGNYTGNFDDFLSRYFTADDLIQFQTAFN